MSDVWSKFLHLLNSPFNGNGGGSNYSVPTGQSTVSNPIFSDTGGGFNRSSQRSNSSGSPLEDLIKNTPPGQMRNNLIDMYSHGSGSVKEEATSTPPLSIADQLQQQLKGIQVHTTPYDELLKQATAQVNAQFDPQINQLLRDMDANKSKATQDEGTARSMYNALAQDQIDQLPGIQSNMQAQQKAISSRYNDAQQNLQGQYQQQSQNQQDVLQRLGIQAASQDANQQFNADQSYFQNQNKLSSNQAQDQLSTQGNADQAYARQMSGTDKLAGENAAQDIATQLRDYLDNAGGQLEDMKGSKANALTALLGQMQQTDTQNAQTQYNNGFNQLMQMDQLQRALTNDQTSNQLDQQKLALQIQQMTNQQNQSPFEGTSGMSGLSNFLSEQYPNNPQEASTLSSLITSVLSNPDVQMGRRQNGLTSVPITNEYMIQLLRNAAQQKGVNNPTDINNAIDALLAYKGQLK